MRGLAATPPGIPSAYPARSETENVASARPLAYDCPPGAGRERHGGARAGRLVLVARPPPGADRARAPRAGRGGARGAPARPPESHRVAGERGARRTPRGGRRGSVARPRRGGAPRVWAARPEAPPPPAPRRGPSTGPTCGR